MPQNKPTLLLCCLLLLCSLWLSPARGQSTFNYHYTIESGLPSNHINTVRQDPAGNIWVATTKGISRFDGVRFRNFTTADGLPTNDIFYFYFQKDRKWLYSFKSTQCFIRSDSVVSFHPADQNEPLRTGAISSFGELTLISDGLFKYFGLYDGHKGSVLTHAAFNKAWRTDALLPDITHMQFADSGLLAANNRDSLAILDFRRHKLYRTINPLLMNGPYSMMWGESLYTNHSFLFWRPDKFSFVRVNWLDGSLKRYSLFRYGYSAQDFTTSEYSDNGISLITSRGYLQLDTAMRPIDSLDTRSLVIRGQINSIYRDRSHNYWIGTQNDGIYLVSSCFRGFTREEPPPASPLWVRTANYTGGTIYQNDLGNVMVRNRKGLKRRLDLHNQSLTSKIIQYPKLLTDQAGNAYIFSSRGAYVFTKGGQLKELVQMIRSVSPEQRAQIQTELPGFKDAVLDGVNERLLIQEYNQLISISLKDYRYQLLAQGRYNHVACDSQGRIWCANNIGQLTCLQPDGRFLRSWNVQYPIPDLTADARGNVIFHIDGLGVVQLNAALDKPELILRSSNIQLVKLIAGALWIITTENIGRYHNDRGHYRLHHLYPNVRNLLYQEIFDLQRSGDSMELLSDKGILRFHHGYLPEPDSLFRRSTHVSGLVSGERRFFFRATDTVFQQNYTRNNLTVLFSGISTAYAGDILYHYFLEGRDNGWETTQDNEHTYTPLPPGAYTLFLRAQVKGSFIYSDIFSFRFLIEPLWWQTDWFRILVLLLGLGLVYGGIHWRIRFLKQRAGQKVRLNQQLAELELSALQSQMNPHFIFNSLTSIQSHIKTGEVQMADKALQQFSTLIRMYLEFSRHKIITLAQELKAISLYTEIEQERFGNKFDVDLFVRCAAGMESTIIPPMLVQPVIENAINHGLYHKKEGRGRLRLFFLCRDGAITVVVDDNGIGRTAARALRSKLFPARGHDIVQGRMNVLNASGLAGTTIRVIDKLDVAGRPAGTRVILTIKPKIL